MNRQVLVLGYGIAGKSAAHAAKSAGYSVTIYDDNLQNPRDLYKSTGFNFIYQKEKIKKGEYNYIIKSPGIPPHSDIVQYLKKQDIEVISDLEWAYKLKGDSKLITVTGTNGKTTTTILIDMIMSAGGYTTDIAGNIGIGAPEVFSSSEADYIIVEASSFQLMDIIDYRSDITVITNITSDHLDYHGTRKEYIDAKLNLLNNVRPTDPVVINGDDPLLQDIDGPNYQISAEYVPDQGLYLKDDIIYNGSVEILDTRDIKMVGLHNYYNIMEAIQVGLLHGIDKQTIKDAIKDFPGVEHRLEYVTTKDGVKYYNDSKATNTVSTIYALQSFEDNIVLILGGYDKKEDYTPVLEYAKSCAKHIYAVGETKARILKLADELGYKDISDEPDLETVMADIKNNRAPGDIVLFSPASASWDMYTNFEERGEHFKSLI